MEAIILAGGMGKRLRSSVPDLPKPMAPVRGRPFLAWLLDYWRQQGISGFVLSVGYKWESIRQHFGDSYQGLPVAYAREDTPLGTGGGLLLAAQALTEPGPFLLLNGDTFLEANLPHMVDCHTSAKASLTLALTQVTDSSRYGSVKLDGNGRITDFTEKRLSAGSSLINAGVYLMGRQTLLDVTGKRPMSLETDILPDLLQAGVPMTGCKVAGRFIDIGLPEDYARAAAVLAAGDETRV